MFLSYLWLVLLHLPCSYLILPFLFFGANEGVPGLPLSTKIIFIFKHINNNYNIKFGSIISIKYCQLTLYIYSILTIIWASSAIIWTFLHDTVYDRKFLCFYCLTTFCYYLTFRLPVPHICYLVYEIVYTFECFS